MKLRRVRVHNFRSIKDAPIDVSNYTLLVGANNAGKSNLLNALRVFYDDLKWSTSDAPKFQTDDEETWIEIAFDLDAPEWELLADKYKTNAKERELVVRRYFRSQNKDLVKSNQSNIYGYQNGVLDTELFYGAKNVGQAKLGQIIYVPALTTIDEQTKLSGPSPLRDVLNFLLKKVVASSPTYAALASSFQKLNEEARGEAGFLREVSGPINTALASWNIKLDLEISAVRPEDISKNLVSFSFLDSSIGDAAFDLARYGHGFQRSVIYELIRLAPVFRDAKVPDKKDFNPDLTLILFEEPEAFLHPAQQENMAFHLRSLALDPTQQVILCTHSSIFTGKAAEDIGQIIRFRREAGETKVYQPRKDGIQNLFAEGGALLAALQNFVADPAIADDKKKRARALIANPPAPAIAEAEEKFRYQLWLDGERASLFFADRVLLVEGASERALFSYLLSGAWHDLSHHRIAVVDVLGKFNFHRYMALMKAFQIPYGVILDDDNGSDHHQAINDLVESLAADQKAPILSPPEKLADCLEVCLGLNKIGDRNDKKPLEIMKAITTPGVIDPARLALLLETFKRALSLP